MDQKLESGTTYRHISFTLQIAPESHTSAFTGEQVRRFVINMPSPEEARLIIISAFSSPTDVNFMGLVTALNQSMQVAQRNADDDGGSTTDTSSETEFL